MATIVELFQQAVAHYDAGQLARAEQLLREVIAADPNHADALHHLGLIAYQARQYEPAAQLMAAALRIQPEMFHYACNLGLAYEALKRPADAVTCYAYALQKQPDFPEAHVGMGNAQQTLGRFDIAATHFRHAIRLRPDYPEPHNNLGNALYRLGRLNDALTSYQEALRLRPDYVEAHNNISHALKDLGRLDEAMGHLDEVLRLRPDHADAHWNRAAILLMGDRAEHHWAEALEHVDKAVQYGPDNADAHWNRGVLWLLRGDFERGWPEYEWRWRAHGITPRTFPEPRWDGGPLEGKSILLYGEQGLGDTIQFIRFAPHVKERGGTVLVECQRSLVRLVETAQGVDRVVARGAPLPPFVVQIPLLSLPGILHTTLATLPADVPYLRTDPQLIEHWRRELASLDGFKVGIAWQGNPTFPADRRRSIPLAKYAPLAAVEGVRLISVQVRDGLDQLQALSGRFPVIDLRPRRSASADSFQESAAILKNLDLLITSDTSVPHLAGALAVPVWIAVAFGADWRWMLERGDSPWYPTMRIFRQRRPGDWDDVFARIAAELRMHVASRPPA
jgi:tetratricopeptide (TPR) repeat protein